MKDQSFDAEGIDVRRNDSVVSGVSVLHFLVGMATLSAGLVGAVLWLAGGKNDAAQALELSRTNSVQISTITTQVAGLVANGSKFDALQSALTQLNSRLDSIHGQMQTLAVLNSQVGDLRRSQLDLGRRVDEEQREIQDVRGSINHNGASASPVPHSQIAPDITSESPG